MGWRASAAFYINPLTSLRYAGLIPFACSWIGLQIPVAKAEP